ncbi:MAG TPA: TylF/MycF/NovP-related O-methyltransferase [Candidatus Didemnitutus sp.]|nr:TylF/MycF/NovP-related O-methyltransferase [Candidatus Didemnitutus sp.]
MLRSIVRFANRLLKPFGAELRRRTADVPVAAPPTPDESKYQETLAGVQACFREMVFPELPPRKGRIQQLSKLIGTPVTEAMYIVALLSLSMPADGDVCEFGVAQGATSALLANEILETQKELWLFDSFQGLPAPTSKDKLINDIFNLGSIEKYTGTMSNPVELVVGRLDGIGFPRDRTHIVPGFIEETSKSPQMPQRVCFAYVDLDFYEPIITTLRFLRSRVPPGGAIVVDDYGFFSSGAKTAVDEFVAEAGGEFEMTLPRKFAAEATPFCILQKKFPA